MVEELFYKKEDPGFELEFSQFTNPSSRSGPGVYSASKRSEYKEISLGVKRGWSVRLTT
jgi:hypothetical protein